MHPAAFGRGHRPKAGDLGALRAEALAAVERYARAAFEEPEEFVPGETVVPVSGKVIGAPELSALADAALDGWLTEGRWADRFRARLAEVARAPPRRARGLRLAGEPAGGGGRPARTCTSARCAPATR